VDQVGAALADLYVEPDSEWFRSIYSIAEQRSHAKRAMPASVHENEERAKKPRSEPKEKKGTVDRPVKTPTCFAFNSTAGCSTVNCRFHHQTIAKEQKARVRKNILRLNLVPDSAKVGEE
jgi:CRISPR/Cas system-associated exonuclease Cas4 (RecB family)